MSGNVFYETISRLCLRQGISVTALAEGIGKNSSAATGWKKGASPRPETLKQIADYLGVSIDCLTSGEEESGSATFSNIDFYETVQRLCVERGVSITALAGELGLSKGAPSGWKRGVKPNESTVKKIADYFGVSPLALSGAGGANNVIATHISNSNVVQGNHAQTLIVRNGETTERTLSDQEVELLRVFNELTVKDQTRLLSFAFELEGDGAYSMAARGTEGVVQIRNKKEKKAVNRAFDTADDQ